MIRPLKHDRWQDADPSFDGHLEHPLEQMEPAERLEWLRQMLDFAEWGRERMVSSDSHDRDSRYDAGR